MDKPQMLLITNSDAGSADKESLNEALEVLRAGALVEVRGTADPGELSEALADAGDRTIVVAGGDGSIHAVVQALHDRGELAGTTIGLIPLGTGNDFARTLDVPRSARRAARVVLEGEPRPIDLIVDDRDQVTVNSVHIGAGVDAGANGARWKERLGSIGVGKVNLGRLGYPIGAAQTALNPPSLRLRLEVDGAVVTDDEEVLMVAMGNGASVGGGTELTPDAVPHDGELDVLIATPTSALARLGYAMRLPFGRHEEHDEVRILRGRRIRVSGEEFECNSDGEIDGPVTDRTWRVLPAAYSMVAPGS